MYDKKLREYKQKQAEITEKMNLHSEADEEFYLTAKTMFELGRDARELFESSEPQEIRQLLNFVFQNFALSGQNLTFDAKEPFNRIIATKGLPIGLPLLNTR